MRKIEAQTIAAIRRAMADASLSGRIMKCGNMEVWQSHHGEIPYQYRTIDVYLHGNKIAMIEPDINRMSLYDCEYQTTTTKSRLNALLGAFVPGERISQRQFQWELANGSWDGSDEFPIRIQADNYMLKQAEKLAA